MKNSILFLLVLLLAACNNWPVSPVSQSSGATPTVAPVASQSAYRNEKYGYSLNYPVIYNLTVVSDEYVEIGEKITVEVLTLDPTTPRGDGPVIENTSEVQLAGQPAKLLSGYLGSVGGYLPQQFKRYVLERNGVYFVITLYALGLHATDGDLSQIAQLVPAEVSIFDSLAASFQIP